MGGPEPPVEDVREIEVGTEADVEDEDVDVVGGVSDIGVSGYYSERFMLSEILRRNRLSKRKISNGVVETSHLRQCEFSNIQVLPLNFLLEILCWPAIEFYIASYAAQSETWWWLCEAVEAVVF